MTRKFTGDRLVIATHNAGKLEEFAALLRPLNIACVSAGDLGLPEPDETETTFLGNARIKAHAAARASGLPALSDDSGLTVDALDGAPESIRRIGPPRPAAAISAWRWKRPGPCWRPQRRQSRGWRSSAARLCWPGRMATTNGWKARRKGSLSGRAGAPRGMAMTRCSNPLVDTDICRAFGRGEERHQPPWQGRGGHAGQVFHVKRDEDWQNGGFAVYVHWPFCKAKCPYCDFNSHVRASIDQGAWAAAYLHEIDRTAAETARASCGLCSLAAVRPR